jgi:hypothetical protein
LPSRAALTIFLIPQLSLIVAVGLGVSGRGTGAPARSSDPVVPIIAIAATLTTVNRSWAFRAAIDRQRAKLVAFAPTRALGGWGYTLFPALVRCCGGDPAPSPLGATIFPLVARFLADRTGEKFLGARDRPRGLAPVPSCSRDAALKRCTRRA